MTLPPDLDLLLREREWLTRLTRRLLGDGPDADDLAQETLSRAMSHGGRRPAARERSGMRAWLTTIAKNLTHERRRLDANRRERERVVARDEATDFEALDRAHLRRSLTDEVVKLPEPERSAVLLHYFEDLSHDEVAQRLGVSPETARKRVSRGVQRLRERMRSRPEGLSALTALLEPLALTRTSAEVATSAPAAAATSTPAWTVGGAALAMTLQTKLALTGIALAALGITFAVTIGGGADATRAAKLVSDDATAGAVQSIPGDGVSARGEKDPRRRTSAASPQEATDAGPATHVLVGRVVDQRRRPLLGADVRLNVIGEEELPTTTTEDDGAFRLRVRVPVAAARPDGRSWLGTPSIRGGVVTATAADGRGAIAPSYLTPPAGSEPREVDIGTLVVAPTYSLAVDVPGGPAEVHVALGHERRELCIRPTDEGGTLLLTGLPRGPVYLRATTATGSGRALAFVPEDARIQLEPQPFKAVVLSVVDAASNAPIEGASVTVTESIRVPAELPGVPSEMLMREYVTSIARSDLATITNQGGTATLDRLTPGERLIVRVVRDGYVDSSASCTVGSGGEVLEVRMESGKGRTVRWPLASSGSVVPESGATVEMTPLSSFRQDAPSVAATVVGGELVAEGLIGSGSWFATTDGGAVARVWIDEASEVGNTVAFHEQRRIVVTAVDAGGAPAVGVPLELRNQGNNRVGSPAKTGDDGIATFERLLDGRLELHIPARPIGEWRAGIVATVDLDGIDPETRVRRVRTKVARLVPRQAHIVLHIDGAPRLPAHYRVRSATGVRVVEEWPDQGTLVVDVSNATPGRPFEMWLGADGFADVRIPCVLEGDADLPRIRVELQPVSTLVTEVLRNEDSGRVQVACESLDPVTGTWKPKGRERLSRPNGPRGTFVFGGIGPGLWRVVDRNTGFATDPIEVVSGQDPGPVTLDLRSLAWVTGIVVAEDPAQLSRARVIGACGAMPQMMQDALPGALGPRGAAVDANGGQFRLRVQGDGEVRLVAWHPWLTPHPERGSVVVAGGKDGVVLELVAANEICMAAPQLEELPSGLSGKAARIARFPAGSDPHADPQQDEALLEWHHAPLIDGQLRCALPAGRWTLVMEPGERYAPLVLEDVVVDGRTTLAEARFEEGAALVIDVRVPEGTDAPRIAAFATRVGLLEYRRSRNSRGESVVRLPGLGPGTYHVRYGSIMDQSNYRETHVEVDGSGDVRLELDLR